MAFPLETSIQMLINACPLVSTNLILDMQMLMLEGEILIDSNTNMTFRLTRL